MGRQIQKTCPPSLRSVPFLGTDPASTVNLYGSTRQRTPLTHYTSPEGSHHLFGDRAAEHECWRTGNVGKQETRQRWKLENAAWKICGAAEKTWNKETNGSTGRERDRRLNFGFTSRHTLRCVRDVVQGDIRPHIPAYFCLEGHSERSWVGQDHICVCPLVTMVSCRCPHQQTGATGSNSVDLSGCRTHMGTRLCYLLSKTRVYQKKAS